MRICWTKSLLQSLFVSSVVDALYLLYSFLFAYFFFVLDVCSLYDNMWDDGNSFGPKEVHNYLTRVMYNRRNKFNPLWNSLVLGGVKNGQKYLGTVSPSIFSYMHTELLLE